MTKETQPGDLVPQPKILAGAQRDKIAGGAKPPHGGLYLEQGFGGMLY